MGAPGARLHSAAMDVSGRRRVFWGLTIVAAVGIAAHRFRSAPSPDAQPEQATTPAGSDGRPRLAGAKRRPGGSAPRLQVLGAEDDLGTMPEGLRQDLVSFDDVQLRAELASILLSFDTVELTIATCAGLPCRAEIRSADVAQLDAAVEAISARFQGHLLTEFREEGQGPSRAIVASFRIGTPHVEPLARFGPRR